MLQVADQSYKKSSLVVLGFLVGWLVGWVLFQGCALLVGPGGCDFCLVGFKYSVAPVFFEVFTQLLWVQ